MEHEQTLYEQILARLEEWRTKDQKAADDLAEQLDALDSQRQAMESRKKALLKRHKTGAEDAVPQWVIDGGEDALKFYAAALTVQSLKKSDQKKLIDAAGTDEEKNVIRAMMDKKTTSRKLKPKKEGITKDMVVSVVSVVSFVGAVGIVVGAVVGAVGAVVGAVVGVVSVVSVVRVVDSNSEKIANFINRKRGVLGGLDLSVQPAWHNVPGSQSKFQENLGAVASKVAAAKGLRDDVNDRTPYQTPEDCDAALKELRRKILELRQQQTAQQGQQEANKDIYRGIQEAAQTGADPAYLTKDWEAKKPTELLAALNDACCRKIIDNSTKAADSAIRELGSGSGSANDNSQPGAQHQQLNL